MRKSEMSINDATESAWDDARRYVRVEKGHFPTGRPPEDYKRVDGDEARIAELKAKIIALETTVRQYSNDKIDLVIEIQRLEAEAAKLKNTIIMPTPTEGDK